MAESAHDLGIHKKVGQSLVLLSCILTVIGFLLRSVVAHPDSALWFSFCSSLFGIGLGRWIWATKKSRAVIYSCWHCGAPNEAKAEYCSTCNKQL
jgi:hypothetical protein